MKAMNAKLFLSALAIAAAPVAHGSAQSAGGPADTSPALVHVATAAAEQTGHATMPMTKDGESVGHSCADHAGKAGMSMMSGKDHAGHEGMPMMQGKGRAEHAPMPMAGGMGHAGHSPTMHGGEHGGHGVMMAAATATSPGSGSVKKVDKAGGTLTIAHGPLPGLAMPAMTMAFPVKDKAWLDQYKAGDAVRFTIERQSDDFVIVRIEKDGGKAGGK